MLLSDEDCDSFVGAHATDDERRAYGVLRTGAQRADLFRVLWLKLVGGVYADLDLELRMPLRQAFDRAAGLDNSSRATNFREWAALPPENRRISLVAWDFSGPNFAFSLTNGIPAAYECDAQHRRSGARPVGRDAGDNRTVCSRGFVRAQSDGPVRVQLAGHDGGARSQLHQQLAAARARLPTVGVDAQDRHPGRPQRAGLDALDVQAHHLAAEVRC